MNARALIAVRGGEYAVRVISRGALIDSYGGHETDAYDAERMARVRATEMLAECRSSGMRVIRDDGIFDVERESHE